MLVPQCHPGLTDTLLACLPAATVIANMRGESPEAVATLLMQQEGLRGLQGPTISPVYTLDNGATSGPAAKHGFYACVICVAKKQLYPSVKALQKVSCCFWLLHQIAAPGCTGNRCWHEQ